MAKYSFLQFVRDQWTTVPVTSADLAGKTVMVVGANGGIGLEACRHFARMNPGKLIMVCRSKQKGENAIRDIERSTGYARAELRPIDLNSFASVSAFAESFEREGERLDILVENAGIAPSSGPISRTQDGWETSFQTNVLSTSLLAILLLPSLLRTAQTYKTTPRLVVVSSAVHAWTTLEKSIIDQPNPIKAFDSDEYWTPAIQQARYPDTKLFNLLFVRALNDRLGHQPLIANAVNPGYCISGLRSVLNGFAVAADRVMEFFLAQTSEVGSRQLLWASLGGSENEDELRGAYIHVSQVTEPSDWVMSEEGRIAQDRIWDDLIKELSLIDPKVEEIVGRNLGSIRSVS